MQEHFKKYLKEYIKKTRGNCLFVYNAKPRLNSLSYCYIGFYILNENGSTNNINFEISEILNQKVYKNGYLKLSYGFSIYRTIDNTLKLFFQF